MADGRRLIGAVDTIDRVSEIEGARPSGLPSPPAVKRGRYGCRSIISLAGASPATCSFG